MFLLTYCLLTCKSYLHIKLVASLVASTWFASRIFPVSAVLHLDVYHYTVLGPIVRAVEFVLQSQIQDFPKEGAPFVPSAKSTRFSGGGGVVAVIFRRGARVSKRPVVAGLLR